MGQVIMLKLRPHQIVIAASALLATLALAPAWAAEPTSRGSGSGIVVMDNQGRVLKTIAPEPSRDEVAAKAADAERQRATAKADEDQKRKDRVLLDSYTTEAEIDLARNRATSVLEAQMQVAQAYLGMLGKRRNELAKRKADSGNKPLPTVDEQELAGLDAEMQRQNVSLLQKKQDLDRVVAKYAADKNRWEELRGKPALPASAANAAGAAK